jgi:hypothetical protein
MLTEATSEKLSSLIQDLIVSNAGKKP